VERLEIAGRTYLLTAYALRRMALRGISLAEVRAVLGRPTALQSSRHDRRRLVLSRTVRGRRLFVVIEVRTETEANWEVVTAWEREQDG